jgi:hypothetical protein
MSKGQPPPEPIPQSTVLALQAWKDKSKISNASWETRLNEAVVVNPADSVFVKASFIDTRGGASGNIDLAVDTEISLEYYFYWIHTFNACDPSGLVQFPTTPDASYNLNQQVLVGGPAGYIINSLPAPNIPGYYAYNYDGVDGKFAATNLNDADGLPYLVYQSSNESPVAPIVGPSVDALNIAVGQVYIVTVVGLTINWEYAGVTGANYNKLPAGWDLNTSYFLAAQNPYYNLPTSAFIPAALAAPLPYITYIITNVGDTDWPTIDPGLASNPISALAMVNGARYAIATVNPTWDFTYWGAGSNTVGTVFTATIPPALPVTFPFTITSATFLANVSTWFIPNGGPIFGADPTDTFNVVIDVNAENNMVLISVTGSGGWLIPDGGFAKGGWEIPNSFFGFTAQGTPLANQPAGSAEITNIVSTASTLSVNDLNVGATYTVLTTGELDGSVPQFTWDMVGSFTESDTADMTVGLKYQVIAPQTNTLILDATNNGLVSEIFTATQTIIIPALTQVYNSSSSPPINDCELVNEQGTEFITYLLQTDGYECFVTINANLLTGVFEYAPFNTSQFGAGSTTGAPFTELPLGNPQPSNLLTLTIPAGSQTGTQSDLVFVSNPTGSPSGFDQENIYAMVCNTPIPPAQNLIVFSGVGQIFTATAKYTGTGSTATVNTYTTTSADITGSGYTPPTVESVVIEVGTVVHAINPDPGLPADTGGRADVSELQAGSNTPFQYDGFVATYVPPTFKFETRPVKKKWAMTIPKGSYNPNYLAELISRNMSKQKIKRVNNVKGGPFSKQAAQSTLTVPTDSVYSNVPGEPIWANPSGGGANTFFDSKNDAVYTIPPLSYNYNLPPDNADDMPFLFCPAMNSTILGTDTTANPTGSNNNFIWAEAPHPNANGLNNLPQPSWYINLVPLCKDVKSVSPTLEFIDVPAFDGNYSILPFYSQNSVVVDGETVTGNSGIFPIVFGATQTSLLYNNENNGLFSFNYLHSPIYAALSSASTDLAEVTAHMYTTQKVSTNMSGTNFFTTLIDKKSGILLNKMEPASFWEQLGFNIEALTVDLDTKPTGEFDQGFQMTFAEFQAKTTGGFAGSSDIYNPLFKTANSADQPCVPDTELIYLTAVPAVEPSGNIITAYNTTPLVVGQSYKIYYPGEIFADEQNELLYDWSSIGGPNVGSNPTGFIFTATSTGFDPNQPPDGFSSWQADPTVVAPETPVTTDTQLQNTYFQVENTNGLTAATIPTVRDATGHYLVEITGYNSNYIDSESKHEIKAIVSSYWVSSGAFVSSPFPDSYNFFGTGAPVTLSGIKVRILDPYTGREAIIGPNSSIYLQVNKMLTEQAVAQIPN